MAGDGSALAKLGKLVPALGVLINRVRHPKLHCGVHVELPAPGRILAGDDVRIGAFSRIYLDAKARLELGDGVGLGRDTHIQSDMGAIRIADGTGVNDRARLYGSVSIGRYCAIGPNLMASSGTHVFNSPEPFRLIGEQEARFPAPDRPVVIEDDCWIGINVVIRPGVTIGRGAVVGANSVVTRDVEPYTVVAGSPARKVRERLRFAPPSAIDSARPEDGPYFYAGFAHRRFDIEKGLPFDQEFTLVLSGTGPVLELRVTCEPGARFILGSAEAMVSDGIVRLPCGSTAGERLRIAASARGWLQSARVID
jgi:acetyltransferase-like isoleucine patch superfamily enzyme